jgi:orotate phosphoribosyltransferase
MVEPIAAATSGGSGGGNPDAFLHDRLLELVLARGYARSTEPFVLSSGGTSHDYVDLRRAVASGGDLRIAADAVVQAIERCGVRFDAIGGMTMGADPVAHAVALLTGAAWFSVRKAEKSHGSRRRIEGAEMGPGVRAVVFEDTVSTSRSMLEALDAVQATGTEVVLACTLLDRGDTAKGLLAGRSVPYHALLTYGDLGIAPLVSGPGTGTATEASRSSAEEPAP